MSPGERKSSGGKFTFKTASCVLRVWTQRDLGIGTKLGPTIQRFQREAYHRNLTLCFDESPLYLRLVKGLGNGRKRV